MNQQDEALRYFRSYAEDWQHKAVNPASEYSVIEERNNAVLATMEAMGTVRRMLDVGCGTGQLVIEAARRGVEAHGIDFAPEMIEQCERNRAEAGVAARFDCISFFDLPAVDTPYDVVSAQGFIEYIAPAEMEEFFARCARLLGPGGSLAVGSRNRLYNAVSMNAFTALEAGLGVLGALVAEAISLHTSASQAPALDTLRTHERIDEQPRAHPDTGIGVAVRYQYSPAELIGRLRRHGFEPARIWPIHFHALAPGLKEDHPALHHEIAKAMQRLAAADPRLVPFCSTFVLDVRRRP